MSVRIGGSAVDLFSKEHTKRFYAKHGFIPLCDDLFYLYLPMATVREMFAQTGQTEQEQGSRDGFLC